MQLTDDELKIKCTEISKQLFGNSFNFRPYQLDTIIGIIKNESYNVKCQVMNAPTGSGKSVIAIVVAEVLYHVFGKKSYILVSDLSLFDQYVNDIDTYRLSDIGYVKGKDNYVCRLNNSPVHCSVCSLSQIPMTQMISDSPVSGFSCKDKCKYINDYKNAVISPITLMTYQMYFIQRNYVEDIIFGGENPNFPKRDFVICDEAHKICDIAQTHFSPVIEIDRPKWMCLLDEYAHSIRNYVPDEHDRKLLIEKFISCDPYDGKRITEILTAYSMYLQNYSSINTIIRSHAHKLTDKKKLKKYLIAGNTSRDCMCKISDQLDLINVVGSKNIVVKSQDKENITLNCIYENLMLLKYFHAKSGNELLMSATIGDYNVYLSMIGIEDRFAKLFSIPSTFDYTKSPIYYSTKNKMSYSEKYTSVGNICKQIEDILNENEDKKGIIQTGNYENSKVLMFKLPNDLKNRLIFYDSAKNKKDALEKFKESTNGVLIGPTLLEGLNFPGDECRFSICMKLPFASLANNFVCKKKDLVKDWYTYDVINKLEQGFGRGVRFNGDWCVNYILDGCIMPFVFNDKFNEEIRKRLKPL